jgi:choline monooxygenase
MVMKDIGSQNGAGMEPIAAEAERAFTLPGWAYRDREIFAREREAIFRRGWVCVGHLCRLAEAGDFICGYAGDQHVFVIRGEDGRIRGFHNVCQHRAHPLLEGHGTGQRLIVCPYHAWGYDTRGRLVRAPGSERLEDFAPEAFGLTPVAVEVFHGLLFVNCDPDASPLSQQAPDLAREIESYFPDLAQHVHLGTIRYDMKMNWKVRIDNSLECYHCLPVHKSFCEIVDMKSYRTTVNTVFSTQIGQAKSPATDGEDDHVVFWYVWPLTELNADTSSGMFGVFHNRPVDPGRTILTLDLYGPADLGEAQRAEVLQTWLDNETNVEDLRLGEAVQQGVMSIGYRQGRFVVDRSQHYSEHAVHHFHYLVAGALDLPREG